MEREMRRSRRKTGTQPPRKPVALTAHLPPASLPGKLLVLAGTRLCVRTERRSNRTLVKTRRPPPSRSGTDTGGSEETRGGGRGAGGGKSEGDGTTEGRSRSGEEEDRTVETPPAGSREREDGNERVRIYIYILL